MDVLNGPVEVGVRIAVLLDAAFPEPLGRERISLLDHALLHSGDVNGPASLHPDLPIRSGELGVKRRLIDDGLQLLIRASLAEIKVGQNGIEFAATDKAFAFLNLLESPYVHRMRELANWVIQEYAAVSDESLRDRIGLRAARWRSEYASSSSDLPPEEYLR